MKIFVKVKPNSKKDGVQKIDADRFSVLTKSPPREGRANIAVIEALSQYFDIPRSRIKILAGAKSKQKHLRLSKKL